MINETTAGHPDAPTGLLPPAARAELARTAWAELPHRCSGRHGVPDTPDVLAGVLSADPAHRVRAVGNLYRLLLDRDGPFPATAPRPWSSPPSSTIRAPSPRTTGSTGRAVGRCARNC